MNIYDNEKNNKGTNLLFKEGVFLKHATRINDHPNLPHLSPIQNLAENLKKINKKLPWLNQSFKVFQEPQCHSKLLKAIKKRLKKKLETDATAKLNLVLNELRAEHDTRAYFRPLQNLGTEEWGNRLKFSVTNYLWGNNFIEHHFLLNFVLFFINFFWFCKKLFRITYFS